MSEPVVPTEPTETAPIFGISDRWEVVGLIVLALIFALALWLLHHDKWHTAFGCLGSLLLVFPPGRQMLVNARFDKAAREPNVVPGMDKVRLRIITLAKDRYVQFSQRDVWYLFFGAALVCTSFTLDAFGL